MFIIVASSSIQKTPAIYFLDGAWWTGYRHSLLTTSLQPNAATSAQSQCRATFGPATTHCHRRKKCLGWTGLPCNGCLPYSSSLRLLFNKYPRRDAILLAIVDSDRINFGVLPTPLPVANPPPDIRSHGFTDIVAVPVVAFSV